MNSKLMFLLILCILLPGQSLARDKVVIIPLIDKQSGYSVAVAGYDEDPGSTLLDDTEKPVLEITLELPDRGLVIVNASGYFKFYNTLDKNSACRCSITQGTAIDIDHLIVSGSETHDDLLDYTAFGATRAFPLDKGTHNFRLVCDGLTDPSGVPGFTNMLYIGSPQMNAVYHYMPTVKGP